MTDVEVALTNLGESVIANKNSLNYKYIDEKLLEEKKEKISNEE